MSAAAEPAPKPTDWTSLAGGRAAFEAAYAEIADLADQRQHRLAAALDELGPPGMAAWDPFQGFVELRGRRFDAQMLGSFDGRTWLWSWANPHLQIPAPLTAYARGLRDLAPRVSPALAAAMIADDDEGLPAMFGALAIAHGFGEAFYCANESQIYLLAPAQLDALLVAAGARLTRYATCFSRTRRTLAEVVAHLRGHADLSRLDLRQVDDDLATIEGPGYRLAIRRVDRLRRVLEEVQALGREREQARGSATVFIVEGSVDVRVYAEPTYAASFGLWAPTGLSGARGRIPWQALAVAERLARLDRALVHDSLLGGLYPPP